MSQIDDKSVMENEEMVEDYYSDVLDVVMYFRGSYVDSFKELVIDEAMQFYDKKGFSPIVERNKPEGSYAIDYSFLIYVLQKHIQEIAKENGASEKMCEIIRAMVERDFKNMTGFANHGKFLISLLELVEITARNNQAKLLYTQTAYTTADEKVWFILNSIVLHTVFIKKYKEFLAFASKEKYILKGFGNSSIGSFTSKALFKKVDIYVF